MQFTSNVSSDVAPGSIMTCSRCGHQWAIRKRGDLPKNCPKCRSTLWMKNYHVYTCTKCQHSWGTANENPLRCPKCHTSKWNAPVLVRKVVDDPIKCRLSPDVKEQVFKLYREGMSVIQIAITSGIAFGEIMDALMERNPNEQVRI